MNLLDLLNIEANRKLHDKYDFQGLKISIENRAGSIRQGVDKDGKPWKVKMTHDYGYIRKTKGVDGDHVDCFIGPDKDAKNVYIIHRIDPDTGKYDEDKCMLGFSNGKDAKSTFLANYDRPGNFGSMDEMSLDKFKEKVLATKDKPMKLAAGGPGSGRHKYAVGDRVMRTPTVKQWKINPMPGVIVSQEIVKDNKDKPKLGYRVLHDKDKKNLNHPDPWQRTNPKGTPYLESELVPEKKK